jgi:hypothetical protein
MNRGTLVINVTCCGLNDQGSIFKWAGILRRRVHLGSEVHPDSQIGKKFSLEADHSNLSTFQNKWSY